MRLEEVEERVQEICEIGARDPEAAHSKEDSLYRDILEYVASENGKDIHKSLLAQAALRTQKEDFHRWCS